jgi:hypothetical protein
MAAHERILHVVTSLIEDDVKEIIRSKKSLQHSQKEHIMRAGVTLQFS